MMIKKIFMILEVKKKVMKEINLGIFLISFMILVYGWTTKFPKADKSYNDPAYYPKLIILFIIILSIINISTGVKQLKIRGLTKNVDNRSIQKPLVIAGIMIGYLILLYFIGYLAATFTFLITIFKISGGTWGRGILFSTILTLGLYTLFSFLLKIPLPKSLFW